MSKDIHNLFKFAGREIKSGASADFYICWYVNIVLHKKDSPNK